MERPNWNHYWQPKTRYPTRNGNATIPTVSVPNFTPPLITPITTITTDNSNRANFSNTTTVSSSSFSNTFVAPNLVNVSSAFSKHPLNFQPTSVMCHENMPCKIPNTSNILTMQWQNISRSADSKEQIDHQREIWSAIVSNSKCNINRFGSTPSGENAARGTAGTTGSEQNYFVNWFNSKITNIKGDHNVVNTNVSSDGLNMLNSADPTNRELLYRTVQFAHTEKIQPPVPPPLPPPPTPPPESPSDVSFRPPLPPAEEDSNSRSQSINGTLPSLQLNKLKPLSKNSRPVIFKFPFAQPKPAMQRLKLNQVTSNSSRSQEKLNSQICEKEKGRAQSPDNCFPVDLSSQSSSSVSSFLPSFTIIHSSSEISAQPNPLPVDSSINHQGLQSGNFHDLPCSSSTVNGHVCALSAGDKTTENIANKSCLLFSVAGCYNGEAKPNNDLARSKCVQFVTRDDWELPENKQTHFIITKTERNSEYDETRKSVNDYQLSENELLTRSAEEGRAETFNDYFSLDSSGKEDSKQRQSAKSLLPALPDQLIEKTNKHAKQNAGLSEIFQKVLIDKNNTMNRNVRDDISDTLEKGSLVKDVYESSLEESFQRCDNLLGIRHGRVQSVKLLSEDTSASAGGSIPGTNGGVRSGKSATVAFIDIRSAAKAFRAVHSMAGQPLDINYHEPGSAPPRCHPPMDSHSANEAPSDIPVVIGQGSTSNNVSSSASPGIHNNTIPGPSAYRQQRFPLQHGQSEESSSHFYDQPKGFSRGRGDGHGYRGRRDRHNNYNRHSFHNMDRGYRMSWGYSNDSGRVAPPPHLQADERTAGPTQSTHPPVTSEATKPPRRPDSPASTVSSRHVPSKRHKSRSVSESGSSDRGSTAGSRSRSGSRSSVSTSVSSGRSRSPPHHGSSNHFSRGGSGAVRFHQNSYSRQRYRRSRVTNRPTDSRARHSSRSPAAASPSSSTSSSPSPHRKAAAVPPLSPSHSPSSSKSYSPSRGASTTSHHHHQHHRRPPNTAELHAAIKIRNLPVRSSDTSLKDGLYHAYKKHGKVAWVRVIGSGSDRYAIVCFKSQEYAAKAVQSSQDKQFFGCKIQVTPYYTGKSEESVGGTDEESRGPGEEESSFPTRTVLITSLDSSVNLNELKSAFDQYGDIVTIEIRKQGSSTHAVCEFLDIASAIRAKWGRHVFKSREARISFFRNPPTNALLLDGTAGVTEKQVTSHCCQYGAITRVDMDPERFLALVQYEEISSAETAIRELGNWAIKGKKLDIDFASQEVIRRFQDRLEPGLSNSSLSVCGSSSPSSNSISVLTAGAFKDGSARKGRNRIGYLEDDEGLKANYHTFRNELDVDSKPMTTLKSMDESSPTNVLNANRIITVSGRDSHENLNSTLELHSYKRLEPAADSQRNPVVCTKQDVKDRTDKFSSSSSIKIDLNCHETDSAIVTSSSDIIAVENSDTDVHSNFTGSSASGDEKVGSFEPATKHRKSCSENVSSVLTTTTTVDGVSSTSPEPKTEIVSTSADPGIGIGTDSVARYLNDAVATDPHKRNVESKIRRTSADSGNHLNSSPECNVLHSNQEADKVPVSQKAKSNDPVRQPISLASNSQGVDESDDRPGTPLFDENPEGFGAPVISPSLKSDPPVPTKKSKGEPTLATELPKLNAKSQSADLSKDLKSSSSNITGSCQTTKKLVSVSPTISPSSGASSSVMLSSTNDTSIFSPSTESSETPAYSKSSTNVLENSNTSIFCVAGVIVKRESTDDISNGAVSSDVRTEKVTSVQEVTVKSEVAENDECASGAGFSSDSEGGLSPRHSPTTDSLEQRVKNLCEKYDTWDGNRKILKHTPVSHSPLHSNQDMNGGSSNKDSLIDKLKQTIPHYTGTSDIGRTVLAKKTIFDEDCERLVNFTNWKLPSLSRSTSCSSTSSAPFLGQAAPLAVNSNCAPPLSSPISSIPAGSFNGAPTPKSLCSSPSYSPSLSSAIIGKSVPDKVKDLNANVASQLVRSLGLTAPKALSSTGPNKPGGPLGAQILASSSTKLTTSPPSLPNSLKTPMDLLTTTLPIAKPDMSSVVSKKPLHTHPVTSTHATQPHPAVSSTASSLIASVLQNNGPRAVERSLSLESRKSSSGVNPGFQVTFPSSSHTTESLISAESLRPSTPRRISVDTPSSASSTVSVESGVSKHAIHGEKFSESSEGNRDKQGSTDSHASHSFKDKVQSKEAVVPSCKTPNNTLINKKNVLSSLKDEISSKVQPVHQETTVAVVASVQTQLLTSRNEVINTSKESSKKDKDKKRRSSGSSTPISSGSGGHQSGSSSLKNESHSNQGSSTSSSRSSGKDKDERKERKEKESKSSTSHSGESGNRHDDSQSHHGSSHHVKKERRDKDKDHRDASSDRTSYSTSNSKESHSHKRDKDNKESGKTKRRLSSQENEQDRKKSKMEKEGSHQEHHHHRSKANEIKDSREIAKEHRDVTKDSRDIAKDSRESGKDSRESAKDFRDGMKDPRESTRESRDSARDPRESARESRESIRESRESGRDSRDSVKESRESAKEIKEIMKEPRESITESREKTKESRESTKDSREPTKDPKESVKDSRESTKETRDKLSSKERPEKETTHKSDKSSGGSSSIASGQGTSSDVKKEKSDGKERDHHHKSKSSTSSSSSKHHSHNQVQKSRSSTESHSSSTHNKQDSHVSNSHKKDKEKDKSSGKENSSSKSVSKHHSHTSHSSSSSSKSKDTSGKSKSSRRDREKPKPERSNSALDTDGDDNDLLMQSSSAFEASERSIKIERSERKESEGKRDRHKSGGGDSGTGLCDSEKSKNRKKEPKKRRRLVVEDSGTTDTDDEEEEKKHHSIFDVILDTSDYYVSMYDKVKRSNRACKNTSAQQKQQEEEKRKQEKVSESFNKLKQSRAKREEKKRSTSIEERKSMTNSSSDEGSLVDAANEYDEHRRRHHDHHSEKAHSSDNEDQTKLSSTTSTKSKSKRKNKSSRKDDEKDRKRIKRYNKSPTRSNMYSSSTLFSHSDDDSPASTSHPPEQKKKKLSSSSGRHQISSLGSSNNMSFSGSTKSSDESHSELENIERKKSTTSTSSKQSRSFVSFSDQLPNHQPKFNPQNIYSDSDSSDVEHQNPHKPHPVTHSQVSHRSKSKEKSIKTKPRKLSLFDSTDSSENDEPVAPPVNREKKSKDRETSKPSKSRDKDKENKNKKKHRSHKSSLKTKKQYYNSGDASGDGGSHVPDKRESGATMEELFGSVTSSSESEEVRESDHERPKTPTVVLSTPSACEDATAISKKSKTTRHFHDKGPFIPSISRSESHASLEESEVASTHATPPQPPVSAKPSEKKKKKHHKEKRSKRGSGHEGTPLSSQSSSSKQESTTKVKQESVDYDALFNSPAASPVSELKIDCSFVPSNKASSVSPPVIVAEPEPVPEISIRAPTPLPPPVVKTDRDMEECEKEMIEMFSSDEDEDDEKLKITDAITDAIRASADEQDMDSTRENPDEVDTEWKIKEDEEKKLNSLVEQDKAIESIVLLERKSPTPQSTNPEEDVVKDEIPKDNATISQEETDVAVATILETLGIDEEADDGEDARVSANETEKPLAITPAVAVTVHSPPRLRIIEDAKPIQMTESKNEIESAIAAIPPRDSDDNEKDEIRDEPDPWSCDDIKSPKELQIDEGDVEDSLEELTTVVEETIESKVRSIENVQEAAFDEVSIDATEAKNKSEEKLEATVEPAPKVSIPAVSEETLSSKAGDVYEFHDSDDDKRFEKSRLSHPRQTPPMISPPAKSPVVQVPVPPAAPEPKLLSPPVPVLPVQLPKQLSPEPEKLTATLPLQTSLPLVLPSPVVSVSNSLPSGPSVVASTATTPTSAISTVITSLTYPPLSIVTAIVEKPLGSQITVPQPVSKNVSPTPQPVLKNVSLAPLLAPKTVSAAPLPVSKTVTPAPPPVSKTVSAAPQPVSKTVSAAPIPASKTVSPAPLLVPKAVSSTLLPVSKPVSTVPLHISKTVSPAPITVSKTVSAAPITVSKTVAPAPITVSKTVSPAPLPVSKTVSPVPQPVSKTVSPVPQPVSKTVSPVPQPVSKTVSPVPQPVSKTVSPVPLPVPKTAAPAPLPVSKPVSTVPLHVSKTVSPAPITVSKTVSAAPLPVSKTVAPAPLPVPKTVAPAPLPVSKAVSPTLQPVAKSVAPTSTKITSPPPPISLITVPPTSVSPVVTKSAPTPLAMSRSTIDEIIEAVIRKSNSGDPLPFDPPMPAPITIQPAQRPGRRSRSRSKDSPDENASVNRVVGRPEPQRHGTAQVLGVIGGHQVDTQPPKINKVITASNLDPSKAKDSKKLETLIDPETGTMTQMILSEEGQYVPILGQIHDPQSRLNQPGLLHQLPQIQLPNRQTQVISRVMERDVANRGSPMENHPTPLLPHQQILPKHEGLTAMLAQQQHQQMMQQQQQLLRKKNEPVPYTFQAQGPPPRMPLSIPAPQQQTLVAHPQSLSSTGVGMHRPVAAAYTVPSSHSPKVTTTIVSSSASSSPTGIQVSNHGQPPTVIPCLPPVSRGVYVTTGNSPVIYHHQQQQILQLTTNKPQERQSPRPNSRHTPGPIQIPVSQAGKPELVHLPEIPMATTVTKINAGEEQRKSAIMQSIPNVVLASTPGAVPAGPPYLIRTVVSSPSAAIPMTQQQQQQHRTLQEAFLRSAEGNIRLSTGKDDPMELSTRTAINQELIGLSQPQRVEIHGGSMHPPAHSPKPGRVPLPHELLPTAHANQPRSLAHRPGYETPGDSSCIPLDLVTQSSNNNSVSDTKSNNGRNDIELMTLTSHVLSNNNHAQPTTSTLMTRKGDMRIITGQGRLASDGPHYISTQPDMPTSFTSHYITTNHSIGHQPSGFTIRHDKPGILLDAKPLVSTEVPKGPGMITVVDRPIVHIIPPHLTSPHGNDQRGTDSPSVGAVFPGQRQLYQTSGLPQQQHPTSQAISNMYAELDGRPFTHSPSYLQQYDSMAISVAAAAAAAMEQERERPKGTSSPLDPPFRIRSPSVHNISNDANLQGDSLLHLLQRYPIMWQGLLALKNDSAAVQMHFVSGSMNVARDSLPSNPDGSIPPLRISQRMRLEQNQLEGVARKLQINAEHCMLLALPCGRDHMDVLHQSNNLRQGFITYLQLKQAAGIVNICHPDTQQAAYVIHIFPSCDFANENLAKIAPDLLSGVADIAHLLIVIATV